MDEYRENVKKVQKALNQDAAFIQPNAYLAQRVLNMTKKKGGYIVMKKRTVVILLVMLLTMSSLTAFAAALLVGHDIRLYEGVNVTNLLPDQMQEYDVCHRVRNGYLVGGFNLGDDYIAPMDENDSIVMLDSNFEIQWSLTDPRMEGCLFDKFYETHDALYMGLESSNDGWVPALMKVGLDGTIHWIYRGDNDLDLNDFVVDSQGNAICVGDTQVNGHETACVLMIDSEGKVKDKIELADLKIDSLSAIRLVEDKMIIAGHGNRLIWIGAMESDGTMTWQESVELEEDTQTLRLQTNEDGNIVMSIDYKETNNADDSKHMRYYVVKP